MSTEPNDLEDLQQDQVDISPEAESQAEQEATGTGGADASLQAQIEQLQEELAQAKEQTLRAHAETQNARRRAEQDVEKAHKFGVEKFANDMLPVADNLERALASAKENTGDTQALLEGVELTLKSLIDALKKHKVEQIDPAGEPFDPQLHQAMTMIENPEVEPNTVIDVFQKGYTLHGRLVRPAMVVVSKA